MPTGHLFKMREMNFVHLAENQIVRHFHFAFHEDFTCTCNLQPQFVGETHTKYVWRMNIINACLKMKKICVIGF